jgi:hypothetical protein
MWEGSEYRRTKSVAETEKRPLNKAPLRVRMRSKRGATNRCDSFISLTHFRYPGSILAKLGCIDRVPVDRIRNAEGGRESVGSQEKDAEVLVM